MSPQSNKFSRLNHINIVNMSEFQNSQRYKIRTEPWGKIIYDHLNDEFMAILIQSKIPKPEMPIAAGWLVTAPCNLKCVHCYGNIEELPKEILTTSEQLKIASMLIEAKIMRVTLSGGEPLLRKDTYDVINKFAENDVSVILGTNGSFLTSDKLSTITRTTRVEISLDSHIEEVNNKLRPERSLNGNTFIDTMRAIDLCLKNNIKIRILTSLNKYNYNTLFDFGKFLYSRGIRDWGVSWTMYAGRARFIFNSHLPSDTRVADTIIKDSINSLKILFPEFKIKSSNRTSTEEYNKYYCLIMPNGMIGTEDFKLGRKLFYKSLIKHSVSEVWNEANYNLDDHFKKWIGGRLNFLTN